MKRAAIAVNSPVRQMRLFQQIWSVSLNIFLAKLIKDSVLLMAVHASVYIVFVTHIIVTIKSWNLIITLVHPP